MLDGNGAGNSILAANPHWLILVQGIQYYSGDQYWWGGQLLGAALNPVRLARPNKLVYSPHDYGPSVSWQAWFGAAMPPAYRILSPAGEIFAKKAAEI